MFTLCSIDECFSDHAITAEECVRSLYPDMMSSEEATKILNKRGYLYLNEFLGERVIPDTPASFDYGTFIPLEKT